MSNYAYLGIMTPLHHMYIEYETDTQLYKLYQCVHMKMYSVYSVFIIYFSFLFLYDAM
jgi:hypothetical protein